MIHPDGNDVLVDVLVQPRASRAKIGPIHGDRIKVAVTSPPVDGAANKAVCDLFAKQLKLARSDVEVVAGETSRRKRLRLRGVTPAQVQELLG